VTATIIDGAWIAQEVREVVAAGVQALQRDHGVTPGLAAVLIGDNPASASYVQGKEKACSEVGIFTETFHLPQDTSQDDVLDLVRRLNDDDRFHGILTQLPFPAQIDEASVIRSLHTVKDVDGLHPYNMGLLALGEPVFICATPSGVQQLLLRTGNDPAGKHVVVVGRSNIVGRPMAALLLRKAPGGNATVTVAHSRTPDLGAVTREADILIVAIGQPAMIRGDMVKAGAVVIDVGVNRVDDDTRERGYRLTGDVAYDEVREVASAISPVPGGVGPMTIAMLLANTVEAAVRSAAAEG